MLQELVMNGWRKRIGYISPSVHETTLYDFFQYRLTGVGIVGITSNIETWAKDQFENAMSRVVEDARSLATRKVDYIIYAGTPLLVSRGKGADVALIGNIRDATGIDATTSISAEMAAMHHFGARRIAMASPYPPDVQRSTIEFLRAHGFDVIKEASMNVGFHVLQEVQPSHIYKFARDVARSAPEADVIYVPCPQWPVQSALEAIEHDTGKPVVAGDPAKFWAAFKSVGIHDRIDGFGRLLRSLSDQRSSAVRGGERLRQAS